MGVEGVEMMRTHTKFFLIGVALLAIAAAAQASEPEVVEMQMPGEPGQRRLVVTLLSGQLHITGTDGNQLRVQVTQSGGELLAASEPEPDPRAQGLSKLTGVASGLFVRERAGISEVEVASELTRDAVEGTVFMEIQVPRDVELDITSQFADEVRASGMSGPITVRANEADVTVHAATGTLKIQTVRKWIRLYDITGPVEANTSFGGIEGTLSELSPDKPIWLTAAVGPIDVALPGQADATFTLGSTWGEIYSDFDVTLEQNTVASNSRIQAPPAAVPAIPRGANAIDPENVVMYDGKSKEDAPEAPPARGGRADEKDEDTEVPEAEEEAPAEGASVVGKSVIPRAEPKKSALASEVRAAAAPAPVAPPSVKRYVGKIGAGKADIRIQTGSKNIYIRRIDKAQKKKK